MTGTPAFDAKRRRLIRLAGSGALIVGGGLRDVLAQRQPPAIVRPGRDWSDLPPVVMSGDVTVGRAVVWGRADRPSRMWVDVATTESMKDARRMPGPLATATSDFTARVELAGLRPGQTCFYQVRFEDLANPGRFGEAAVGRFRSPAREPRDLVFAFSGDEAGQGWGIDESRGGYRVYASMRRFEPDFFIHSGDQIYADGPLEAEVVLDDGTTWRNRVTPAKAKVAETLDDFRGNFAYNLLDANKRRFLAEVPMLAQWDDHEVRNNWYPGERLAPEETRYDERDVSTLAHRARRATLEYNPIRLDPADPQRIYRGFRMGPLVDVFMLDERSYRGPNSANRQPVPGAAAAFLGPPQARWLEDSLLRSRATWKVIASDMPLSIVVQSGGAFEAWANGDDGAPTGRELEVAHLLRFVKRHGIRNVVWVTADVHYASATHYRPELATFTDFTPFWEFVGGPLHAGTFGPGPIDRTFGPDVKFVGIPPGMKQNRPPSDNYQFFGIGRIDARSKALTVSLHDGEGAVLYRVELPADGSHLVV